MAINSIVLQCYPQVQYPTCAMYTAGMFECENGSRGRTSNFQIPFSKFGAPLGVVGRYERARVGVRCTVVDNNMAAVSSLEDLSKRPNAC